MKSDDKFNSLIKTGLNTQKTTSSSVNSYFFTLVKTPFTQHRVE